MNNISNIENFTVSQLNNSIKKLIEKKFEIISVIGEISQVKKHTSGHIYFSLKDEESIIAAICWRSTVPSLNLEIEEGIKVIIKGRVTTYSQQSKYQLIVQKIEFEGEGTLLKLLENRKKKLSSQGLFNKEYKKNLPKFPNSIGVVTSESGAVIQDIIHRISDRFPINLTIYPANVQGKKCLKDVISGIEYFNSERKEHRVDIIIIARGGGSLEDLMPFNEELLVDKIFNSNIPVISAVGHETDFTLCDLVSDLRAPTPSSAAEMAVPDRKEIILRLLESESLLRKIIINNLKTYSLNFKLLISKIPDLIEIVNNRFQELDNIELLLRNLLLENLKNKKIYLYESINKFSPSKFESLVEINFSKLRNGFKKLEYLVESNLSIEKEKFISKVRELSILSYKETLKRGFAVVRKSDRIVKSDIQIKKNQLIEIQFHSTKTLAKKI